MPGSSAFATHFRKVQGVRVDCEDLVASVITDASIWMCGHIVQLLVTSVINGACVIGLACGYGAECGQEGWVDGTCIV